MKPLSIKTGARPTTPRKSSFQHPASPRFASGQSLVSSPEDATLRGWVRARAGKILVVGLLLTALAVLALEETMLLGFLSGARRVSSGILQAGAPSAEGSPPAARQPGQRFPVLTVCPTSPEFDDQIRRLECEGVSGDFGVVAKLASQPERVLIGSPAEAFECLTLNLDQSFVGNDTSDRITCQVTYNLLRTAWELKEGAAEGSTAVGQGRVTSWGNPQAWPRAAFHHPSSSAHSWRNLTSLRLTKLSAALVELEGDRDGESRLLPDLRVRGRTKEGWEGREALDRRGAHASFEVALADPRWRVEDRTRPPAAGGVGKPLQPPAGKTSAWTVLWLTLFMALATGLGSVPFYFTSRLDKRSEGVCQSMAVGVMIAASYSLIQESEGLNNVWLVLGIAFGMVFIQKCHKFLDQYEDVMEFSGLKGMDAKKIVLFIGVMTLHAVGEGCGVGVSFAGPDGMKTGLLVTLAIGLHNIPEGLATATVLASKGVGVRELTAWTIITALPQCALAVPAYLFVQVFHPLFPFFAGFAAGCMIWISFEEIVPDALENVSPGVMATATTTTTFAFKAMQYSLDWMMS